MEAVFGCGIEMARGTMRKSQCLLEWLQVSSISCSDVACAGEYGYSGGLSADDGGVDTFAGERIDEAGGVSGEK